MIPAGEPRSDAGYLAAYDPPAKMRTYVRRIDVAWHSWTLDPRAAHRFADEAAARALLEAWLGLGNANRLGVTMRAVDEVRAFNRAARKLGRR
jgi:hypothetical protein